MQFSEPIPGANYFANTKNYPWHRPPDLVDYDEAVDYYISRMDEPEETERVLAMLQIDIHITSVVSAMLMQGISKGKIGIDLAILIAGPLARYIEITANGLGIKHEMGVEDKDRIVMTPTLMRAALGMLKTEDDPEQNDPEEMPVEEVPTEEAAGGLMSPPDAMPAPQTEQDAMLGGSTDEVVEEESVDGLA